MRLPPLVLEEDERVELERRVRARTSEARDAQRARIEFINTYNHKAQPFRWTYDGRPLKVA